MFAGVAQLVEQLTCNQQVGGSSPLAGSRNIKGLWKLPQTLFGAVSLVMLCCFCLFCFEVYLTDTAILFNIDIDRCA